ncbi:unnamed protein product, partial [Chrysoparadoxa australica]
EQDWREWSAKFVARATRLGFANMLMDDTQVPAEGETSLDETRKKRREANAIAYSDLILSCTGVAFAIVEEAKTSTLPSGSAAAAWKAIKERYQVETSASKVELKREFASKDMEVSQDPDEYFMELEYLRMRLKAMNSIIEDDDMIAHVLSHLPDNYSELVTVLEGEIDTLTLNKLRERVRGFYRRKSSSLETTSPVVALAAHQFKGRCRSCGQYGHKKIDCMKKESSDNPFPWNCNYCGIKGHKEADCRKKKRAQDNNKPTLAFVTKRGQDHAKITDVDNWIGDSGCNSHVTFCKDGLMDFKQTEETLQIGDGKHIKVLGRGSLLVQGTTDDGRHTPIALTNVAYAPDMMANLFSIRVALTKPHTKVIFEEDIMRVSALAGEPFHFSGHLQDDGLFHMHLQRYIHPDTPRAFTGAVSLQMDINEFHEMIGHPSEKYTRMAATEWDIKLTGTWSGNCEGCAMANGRQKSLAKMTTTRAKRKLERIFIDIEPHKIASLGGARNWILIEDDYTRMKWSFFVPQKSDLNRVLDTFLTAARMKKTPVRYIRLDNAGEQTSPRFKNMCSNHGVELEYTPRNTPQYNGVVERGFATVRRKAVALLESAMLSKDLREKLWAEAASTATLLTNVCPTSANRDHHSPWKLYYGTRPRFMNHLQIFGHGAYVTATSDERGPKWGRRAVKAIMVGYAEQHPGDTYRFYVLNTARIIVSRDVRWTKNHLPAATITLHDMDYDDIILPTLETDNGEAEIQANAGEAEIEADNGEAQIETDDSSEALSPSSSEVFSSSSPSTPEQLDSSYVESEGSDNAAYLAALYSDPGDPVNISDCKNSENWLSWQEAMARELKSINERHVWEVVDKAEIPQDMKELDCKWVFKIKHPEDPQKKKFKARCVVRGFLQIPGVDYSESFSPVVNDNTIRAILATANQHDWEIEQLDVETAFLNAPLEEEVYVKPPEGIAIPTGKALKLHRALYGLVQAPRAWLKTFIKTLEKLGYARNLAEPCMLTKASDDSLVIVLVYVDDCLVVGYPKKTIEDSIKDISAEFSIKRMPSVEEYLGFQIQWDRTGGRLKLHQATFIQHLLEEFDMIGSDPIDTPAPRKKIIKTSSQSPEVNVSQYRSGIGKLMWLAKKPGQ